MKPLFLDTEELKFPLAEPFHPLGKLIYVGVYDETYSDFAIDYSVVPYQHKLVEIQQRIHTSDLLVGANIKHDLHWLRRYGVVFADKLIWDVLLVQFILNHQLTPFNSLNDVLAIYGLPPKLDIVKTEYWDKGIDTDQIPEPILQEYLNGDVVPLEEVYKRQLEQVMTRGILPLIRLHNQDLLMLEEMEWNGNKYDVKGSLKASANLEGELAHIGEQLDELVGTKLNYGSPDQISLLLYGGTYKYSEKEPYTFIYKDGSTKEKIHKVEKWIEMPRLVQPPKTARAKEGFWPTDEATLKKLKVSGKAKKIVDLLLKSRELEKLNGTYLKGFPLRIQESQWEKELIHTNYNQIRAVTGRLSSDKPNCQNNPPLQKPYFISRFD